THRRWILERFKTSFFIEIVESRCPAGASAPKRPAKIRSDFVEGENVQELLRMDVDPLLLTIAESRHDGVCGVPMKALPMEVERKQICLGSAPSAALKHRDRGDNNGVMTNLLNELREAADLGDIVPEVVHSAFTKSRKLG